MNVGYLFKKLFRVSKIPVGTVKARKSIHSNRASPLLDAPLDPKDFGYEVHADDCRRLYKKVVEQALMDYFTRGRPISNSSRRVYDADHEDAWNFLFSDDPEWKNQREQICGFADINPEALSEKAHKMRKKKLNID